MIKIYSQPNCAHCNILKNELKNNNIEFEDINIIEDSNARDEIISQGLRFVPVIKIGEKYIQGVDKVREILAI